MILADHNDFIRHEVLKTLYWSFDTADGRPPLELNVRLIPVGDVWEQKTTFGKKYGQPIRLELLLRGTESPTLRRAYPNGCNYVGMETQNPAIVPVAEFVGQRIEAIVEKYLGKHGLKRAISTVSSKQNRTLHLDLNNEWRASIDFNPSPIMQPLMPKFVKNEELFEFLKNVQSEIDMIAPEVKTSIREHSHLQPSLNPGTIEIAALKADVTAAFHGKKLTPEQRKATMEAVAKEIAELAVPYIPRPTFKSVKEVPLNEAPTLDANFVPQLRTAEAVSQMVNVSDTNAKKERLWKFSSHDGFAVLDISTKLLSNDSWQHTSPEGVIKDVHSRRIQIAIKGFAHPHLSKAAALDGYGFGGYSGDETKNPALYPVATFIASEFQKTLSLKMHERHIDMAVPEAHAEEEVKTHIGNDKITLQVDFNPEPFLQGANFKLASDRDIIGLFQDIEVRMSNMVKEIGQKIKEYARLQPSALPSDEELHLFSAHIRTAINKELDEARNAEIIKTPEPAAVFPEISIVQEVAAAAPVAPEPVVEIAPEPEVMQAAPVEPEPVAEVEPEPEIVLEAAPVEPEPIVEIIPHPEPIVVQAAAVEPEPVVEVQPEPEIVLEAAPVEPEPVIEAAPVAEIIPEPEVVLEAAPVEPEPVIEAAAIEPEPPVEVVAAPVVAAPVEVKQVLVMPNAKPISAEPETSKPGKIHWQDFDFNDFSAPNDGTIH